MGGHQGCVIEAHWRDRTETWIEDYSWRRFDITPATAEPMARPKTIPKPTLSMSLPTTTPMMIPMPTMVPVVRIFEFGG